MCYFFRNSPRYAKPLSRGTNPPPLDQYVMYYAPFTHQSTVPSRRQSSISVPWTRNRTLRWCRASSRRGTGMRPSSVCWPFCAGRSASMFVAVGTRDSAARCSHCWPWPSGCYCAGCCSQSSAVHLVAGHSGRRPSAVVSSVCRAGRAFSTGASASPAADLVCWPHRQLIHSHRLLCCVAPCCSPAPSVVSCCCWPFPSR